MFSVTFVTIKNHCYPRDGDIVMDVDITIESRRFLGLLKGPKVERRVQVNKHGQWYFKYSDSTVPVPKKLNRILNKKWLDYWLCGKDYIGSRVMSFIKE